MKIRSKSSGISKRLLVGLIAALLIAAAAGLYYYKTAQKPTDTYDPQFPVSGSTKQPQPNVKQGSKENPITLPETTENTPTSSNGTITIEDLNQRDGFVNVNVTTANYSTARCVYQFTSEGARPVIKEFQGSCQATSIPQVEFEKIGIYTFTATAYNATEKITVTRDIDVR